GSQAMADRYTYLPTLGVLIMLVWGVAELISKFPVSWLRVSCLLVLLPLAIGLCLMTHRQLAGWRNSLTLWQHALACAPENVLAHENLGHALADEGRWDEAIGHYQRALKFQPDDHEVHNNLGAALAGTGKLDEAVQHYKRAIQLKPDYVGPRN